jgi:hypothetical protein
MEENCPNYTIDFIEPDSLEFIPRDFRALQALSNTWRRQLFKEHSGCAVLKD